jgi:hypothetical protein
MAKKAFKQVITERRQHPRIETLNPANIVSTGRKPAMICMVVDWSHGGARLRPDDPEICPDHFTLVTQDGRWMACQVAWRRDQEIGVKFLKALGVDELRAQDSATSNNTSIPRLDVARPAGKNIRRQ